MSIRTPIAALIIAASSLTVLPWRTCAQYFAFAGRHVQGTSRVPLENGTICSLATDNLDAPIKINVGSSSGNAIIQSTCSAITAGAIASGYRVAGPATTSPPSVMNTDLDAGASTTYKQVAVTGPLFSWDTYLPTYAGAIAPFGYQAGPDGPAARGSTIHGPTGPPAESSATFNVMSFGAVGNGTADDRAAIQAAITAAETTCGSVFFPDGHTFLVNSNPNAGVPGGHVITLVPCVGFSGAGTIKVGSLYPYYGLFGWKQGGDQRVWTPVVFRDIKIDQNGASNVLSQPLSLTSEENIFDIASNLPMRLSSGFTFDNITFTNVNGFSVITTNVVDNVTVQHCHILNAGVGGNAYTQMVNTAIEVHGSNIVVTGNTITDFQIGIIEQPDVITIGGHTLRGSQTYYSSGAVVQVLYGGTYYQYTATTAGTTAASAPSWNYATSSTTTDGSVTWTCNGPYQAWTALSSESAGQQVVRFWGTIPYLFTATTNGNTGTRFPAPPYTRASNLADGTEVWRVIGPISDEAQNVLIANNAIHVYKYGVFGGTDNTGSVRGVIIENNAIEIDRLPAQFGVGGQPGQEAGVEWSVSGYPGHDVTITGNRIKFDPEGPGYNWTSGLSCVFFIATSSMENLDISSNSCDHSPASGIYFDGSGAFSDVRVNNNIITDVGQEAAASGYNHGLLMEVGTTGTTWLNGEIRGNTITDDQATATMSRGIYWYGVSGDRANGQVSIAGNHINFANVGGNRLYNWSGSSPVIDGEYPNFYAPSFTPPNVSPPAAIGSKIFDPVEGVGYRVLDTTGTWYRDTLQSGQATAP